MVNTASEHTERLADFWLSVMAQARRGFIAAAQADAVQLAAQISAALDQAAARAHEHGFDAQSVEHALFATVAWIDEQAMTTDWPGARAWRLAPLQRRYFSTTRAGAQFFQRLDALGEEEGAAREVYGLMLVAGFTGHYGGERLGELSLYRRRLLERLQADGGMRPTSPAHPLFPAAEPGRYESRRYVRRMRPVLAWLLILGGPVLLLVLMYMAFDLSLAAQIHALSGGSLS